MQDLVLVRTEEQHISVLDSLSAVAREKYHEAFVAAGHVHTAEVREAQQKWNALNRILVEMAKLADKDIRVEARQFVAEEWTHECARTTKRDGIPVFDGKFWWCSRCKSGVGVDVRGTTLEVAITMFWKYLANGVWKKREA